MLQKVKPTTASRRQLIKLNNKGLNISKKPLLKNKITGKKKLKWPKPFRQNHCFSQRWRGETKIQRNKF